MIARSELLARVLLLLHLVRGNAGVGFVWDVMVKNNLLQDFAASVHMTASIFKKLHRCVCSRLKERSLSFTHLCHNEGLNAGYSGIHPLRALSKNKVARDLFLKVAEPDGKKKERKKSGVSLLTQEKYGKATVSFCSKLILFDN